MRFAPATCRERRSQLHSAASRITNLSDARDLRSGGVIRPGLPSSTKYITTTHSHEELATTIDPARAGRDVGIAAQPARIRYLLRVHAETAAARQGCPGRSRPLRSR